MEMVNMNKKTITTVENNQQDIRNMVIESYNDMIAGNGRNYKEFFAEMESRYKDEKVRSSNSSIS